MNSSKVWTVVAAQRARKAIARAPRPERERLQTALEEMGSDPFTGDIQRLKSERAAFRRRIGDWRIFFDVDPARQVVDVSDVRRRTTTTYRKR